MSSLNVYFQTSHVGTITFDEKSQAFSFSYDDVWKQNGFEISPHIRFNTPAASGTIKKFLDNLLPEGKGLEMFSLFFQITKNNTLALTREIGNETSGALSFFEDQPLVFQTSKRPVSLEELTARIRVEDPLQLIVWDGRPRLSVAGVQDKLPILYHEGAYSFGEGDLASTHILKFENDRQRHLVLNEYICMTLARAIGLDAAEVEIKRFEKKPALLVNRFDRKRIDETKVSRLHIIDGCQALDLSPTYKYERNMGSGKKVREIREGASLKKLFDFSAHCVNPIKTKLVLLQWALYNLLIANADAHGKNISFFVQNGYRPTPFYDLVSIAMYPEFEQELSMAFGDSFSPDASAPEILAMCEACNIHKRLAAGELKSMCANIQKALLMQRFDDMIMDKKEQVFVAKLTSFLAKRAAHYEAIAAGMK